jgi:PEP-CTERM/exosortase A-associated glycosyltransferase
MPARRAAATAGIPFVYEVRAFWEDGFINRWRGGERSAQYRVSRGLETRLFRSADAVVAISQRMLDDIAARGIPSDRLFRIPNGVDVDAFIPVEKDASLMRQLGLSDNPVVGFIGSFYQFEGLDCLLESMVSVVRALPQARLMLVGSGEQAQAVDRMVDELGIRGHTIVVGRVPHTQVARYYSVTDVLVYPRHRNRTTSLVTPLKPLEAMALGKAVVGSDVGGIHELLGDGRVGLLFEAGNSDDLAAALVRLLRDPDLRRRLGEAGREHALREHSWANLVHSYEQLYRAVNRRTPRNTRAGRFRDQDR